MSELQDELKDMESPQSRVASFLVRFTQHLWQDTNGEPKVAWRGNVKHVQGDEAAHFTDFTDALKFMQDQLADVTRNALNENENMDFDKGMKSSFQIWEQFSKNYSDMVLETWQKSLEKTQQVQDAMQKTFAPWQVSNPGMEEMKMLLTKVAELEARIEELERKQSSEH